MIIDPLDREQLKAFNKLKRQKFLARLVLLCERLMTGLWRPACWTLFFFSLWLFKAPAFFGQIVEVLVVLIFGGGLVYLLYKDAKHLRWPSAHHVNRRLERDSGVDHRPLSGLDDALANAEAFDTRKLWRNSRKKLLGFLNQIQLKKPDLSLRGKDRYSLRFGALTLFVLGLIVAGSSWQTRITDGLMPLSFAAAPNENTGITLWITPPDYTRVEQIILRGGEEDTLFIPQGSILKTNINDGIGAPHIQIDTQRFAMEETDEGSYAIEMEVPKGNVLSVNQMMFSRAKWTYEIIPDLTPAIILEGEPTALPDGPLRFPFMVYDDYGVKDLQMIMSLDEMVEEAPLGETVIETRSVLSPAKTEFEISPLYDLTAHPWAGLPVRFAFQAIDHIGQSADIPPIHITLPERHFAHPVAKAIIGLRKDLIWNPEAPYKEVANALEEILVYPDRYEHDKIVFLNLRSASARLYFNKPSIETSQAVVRQLWDTALRIEDGNLTLAARNLRDAQKALEDALANPETSQAEIAQLMNELRQAMAEYFLELHKETQKRMADGDHPPMIPPEMLQNMMSPDALSAFLDKMESQMLSGDRQSAQEMLSELQRMMESLDPSVSGPMPPDMQMMSDGVNELQELIERQEELLTQTQAQAKLISDFEKLRATVKDDFVFPTVNTSKNKTEQEALRYVLGQLMLEASEILDEIPEGMGLAEQEMRVSSNALGENQPAVSIPHQEQAIEYLKQSQESLSQQFMARMQQMTGMMFGNNTRLDPLGRPMGNDGKGNGAGGSDVKVPSDAERKRAREILELLRARSGERDRPKIERDYYQRLLKQF